MCFDEVPTSMAFIDIFDCWHEIQPSLVRSPGQSRISHFLETPHNSIFGYNSPPSLPAGLCN